MTKRKGILLLTAILLLILGFVGFFLLNKYYLFPKDTYRFHSILSQADGIKVAINSADDEIFQSDLLDADTEAFSKVIGIFRTVRPRPAFFAKFEKFLSRKKHAENPANFNITVRVLLFQEGKQFHSIVLNGSNEIFLDDVAFEVGDISRSSELELVSKILAEFVGELYQGQR